MKLDSIEDSLRDTFKSLDYKGLVFKTESRDKETVLRKVNHTSGSEPITYRNGTMVFFTIEDTFKVVSKSAEVQVKFVCVTTRWEDLFDFVNCFDLDYGSASVEVNPNSLDVYYSYFEKMNDKPFTEYAFEVTVTLREDFKKICCK